MDNMNNRFVPVRERIFALLKEKSIQQKVFAEAIGIPAVTITDWKKGKSFSFMKQLGPIAKALDTSEVWLLTGKEEVTPETVREMEAISEALNTHLLDLLGVGGKLSQYRIDVSNVRRTDGKPMAPEDFERVKSALASGVRQILDEVSPEDRAEFLGMLHEGGALGQTGKKMTTPGDGDGPVSPPGYEALNPTNKAIIDRLMAKNKETVNHLVADLVKSQTSSPEIKLEAAAFGGSKYKTEADADITLPDSVKAVSDEYKGKTGDTAPAPQEK